MVDGEVRGGAIRSRLSSNRGNCVPFQPIVDEHERPTLRLRRSYKWGKLNDSSPRRLHQTLRCTQAMEAHGSDHIWTIEEMVALMDQEKAPRG
jgi:hypothetical protein